MPPIPLKVFPWIGGLNTSLDASTIGANELTIADNIVFGTQGSRKKRDGIDFDWDDASNGTDSLIAGIDFWYGTAAGKTQKVVTLSDAKNFYTYNPTSGARTAITDGGTAYPAAITTATMLVFNNKLLVAVDGANNVVKAWTGSGDIADLGGTPPKASLLQSHLGRVWCNDKTRIDRLHYSTTGNEEEWNGIGDSGALDIGTGDGDPEGITAIFPTFKGVLYVAKKTKLYKILGETPETFQIVEVSKGLGCVGQNSIAQIDQDDMVFVSERGIHSLASTDKFGDFEAAFLSAPIQATFIESIPAARRKYIWGRYLNHINSVAFALTDEQTASGENKSIYLYNLPLKSWYVWPDVSCECMFIVQQTDMKRLFLGGSTTRLAKTFNGTNYDLNTSGTETAIIPRIRTGYIAPSGDNLIIHAFKGFGLIYRPIGTHTVTASVKIDNFPTQSFAFSQQDSADLLGSTFVLGTSLLGVDAVLAPYVYSMDGYGRSVQITITQSGTDEEIEIQGFVLFYEPSSPMNEVTE